MKGESSIIGDIERNRTVEYSIEIMDKLKLFCGYSRDFPLKGVLRVDLTVDNSCLN